MQPLVSIIVGAAIALIPLWINIRGERKRTNRSWLEQTYVIDGIDKLITHLMTLELQVSNHMSTKPYIPISATNEVPVEAIARVRFLLKSPVLVSFLKEVYRCLEDTNTAVIFLYADALKSLIDECIDLRAWFLALIELKPIGKNVFIDAFYYRERIEKMVDMLHQEIASIDQNKQ